ncbi:MAG TPA: alpha amylase C-terminal domain-containing protein [Kiritimatiellia bacterium]|nr:alpha amylase C-terminal domain-containing protein [Kiritimatiellia bacterium]HPS06026.1 alpha amylase C-terminal domain-containing protein [Kiritimatiellia bacterium]
MPVSAFRSCLMDDPYLAPFAEIIARRAKLASERAAVLAKVPGSLAEFACAHEYYGLHKTAGGWVFREWAPNATAIWLVGDFSRWQVSEAFKLHRLQGRDVWEINLPSDALSHGQCYRLEVAWNGGRGERIPAYARRVIQDPATLLFAAQVWAPEPYAWRIPAFKVPSCVPLIYEAHVGMAQDKNGVGTYNEFREKTLPRIVKAGYNTIQLMAVMEHPYYGSFGYHVSNFFACSSRFGTPEDLKALVDAAHAAGIAVIIDLVHSHAVKNEREGLSLFDGTPYQYFHDGLRGWHEAWDSRCFDYGKTDVLHFLLSNCRYWLDEFHIDGYRFDGITSMLYLHHGLGVDFIDYGQYFDTTVDEDAWIYCNLANRVIHEVRPDAISIAEDVSGMPGIAAPLNDLGSGFDYRMAMGVPECWFRLVRDVRDEDWSIGYLWHELTNRRADEQTVNYVESHDQALVGGKTLFFQLVDAAIYDAMSRSTTNLKTDRGVALHKLARLATLATVGHGYLNFMGNEFGHPEWIDFPREGNGFSYHYARRQWALRDNPDLLYWCLGEFDEAIIRTVKAYGALEGTVPRRLFVSDKNKILVFERGPLVFLFNFHSSESVSDYSVVVPPGEYRLILDSDEERFGGHARIQPGQTFELLSEMRGNEKCHVIKVYLPCRTAMVLERKRSGIDDIQPTMIM